MIEEFGLAENKGKSIPMAMTSPAYDVLNDIVITACLDGCNASERTLAEQLVARVKELQPESNDIFLFDRGYPSLYLCAKMLALGNNFVMRCSAEVFLKEVREFAAGGTTDQIVDIDLTTGPRKQHPELQRLVREHALPTLRLRVVKIALKNGITGSRRQHAKDYVNKTVATGILKDEVIEMLLAPAEEWFKKYQSLVATIKRHIIPRVPGRTFPRKEKIPNKSFLKRRKAL
jgi:hypothetical protein